MGEQKLKKVFISHSSKDAAYVQAITELLEDIGLSEGQMVCSSVPEYGIPLGNDIYDWLSTQFRTCELHVLFVLSGNYYDSVACQNEMGAAWVLRNRYDSILLPGFSFRDIKGAVNANQISMKLDSDDALLKQHLNQLKDALVEEFGLQMPSASKWERHRNEFIEKIKTITQELETVTEICAETESLSQQLTLSEDAGELLVNATLDPNGQIVTMNYSGGTFVSTNGRNYVNPDGGPREIARWVGAIEELERYGLIEAATYKRQVFTVTRDGYSVADEIAPKLSIDTSEKARSSLDELL